MAGIYIHIPFCRKACHYCNFHFSTGLKGKNGILASLLKEIKLTPLFEGNPPVETIYFGGGTPSLLTRSDIASIMDSIRSKFHVADQAEISFEANPDDISAQALSDWLELGINRLSLGVQSFFDSDLKWMNRAHDSQQAIDSLKKIREAGFENFSADLIYGMPTLNDENWKQNVERMIKEKVPHLSCYALTVEPRTALSRMIITHQAEDVDPEKQSDQFMLLIQWLRDAGYLHYEISNFSLPGRESRHNSSYWEGKWYYGLGPSAHSFSGKERKWNVANNAIYQQSLEKGIIPFEREEITADKQINEYVMVSLRTSRGIDLVQVEEKFGKAERSRIVAASLKYRSPGKLVEDGSFLRLTDEGKLFADGIASDLFV